MMETKLASPNRQKRPNSRSAFDCALGLLARREHSRDEIERKLLSRGYTVSETGRAVKKLENRDLVNNRRFAENYMRAKANRGIGGIRIMLELRKHGVEREIINQVMDNSAIDWQQKINEVIRKKYGSVSAGNRLERARRMNFLLYRGFPRELINKVLHV